MPYVESARRLHEDDLAAPIEACDLAGGAEQFVGEVALGRPRLRGVAG